MEVGEKGGLHGGCSTGWGLSRSGELAILPDNSAEGIHEDDAVIGRAARALRNDSRRGSGAGHERERADALGIVDADDGIGREVIRPEPKRPDDAAGLVGFDDAIIELISDEKVAGLVEPAVEDKAPGSEGIDGEQNSADEDEDACDAVHAARQGRRPVRMPGIGVTRIADGILPQRFAG